MEAKQDEPRQTTTTPYKQMGLQQFTGQKFAKKAVSSNDINRIKQALTKEVKAIREEISTALSNRNRFPDQGASLESIVNKYSKQDPDIIRELDDIDTLIIPKNVQSSQAGIKFTDKQNIMNKVFDAENEIIEAKTGYPGTGDNMRRIGAALNLYDHKTEKWAPGFSAKRMREMVLLDDFGDVFKKIAGVALPFISMLPGPVGAIAKTVGGALGLGQDVGVDRYDKSNLALRPWSKQFINIPDVEDKVQRELNTYKQGHFDAFKELDAVGGGLFSNEIVNSEWLAGWISPDSYGGVAMPQNQARKVFSANDSKVYQFSSDAQGTVVLAINPANVFLGTATNTNFFIQQQVGYNRSTGAATSFLNTTGPLSAQVGMFSSFCVSQFRITIRSLLSDNNNSGMIETMYFADQVNTTQPVIPGNSFSSTSYKTQSTKLEATVRQWPVFDAPLLQAATAYPAANFFFIAIGGLPANSPNCFEITASYSYDCTTSTTSNSASWLNFSYPNIGPATGALINSLLSQYPWLMFLNEQHGSELATGVRNCRGLTTEVGGTVARYAIKQRPMYNIGSGQKLNADIVDGGLQEISFEQA